MCETDVRHRHKSVKLSRGHSPMSCPLRAPTFKGWELSLPHSYLWVVHFVLQPSKAENHQDTHTMWLSTSCSNLQRLRIIPATLTLCDCCTSRSNLQRLRINFSCGTRRSKIRTAEKKNGRLQKKKDEKVKTNSRGQTWWWWQKSCAAQNTRSWCQIEVPFVVEVLHSFVVVFLFNFWCSSFWCICKIYVCCLFRLFYSFFNF